MNVSYFFFSLSSADTISTFCVVTSDYFSLIFLSFLSSFFGLPPFLIAVHARNRQIHMLVPDDDAWPRYLCRMRSRVCKCVRKSFTCTSFDDSPRCPTFHASHRRADVYSTAAASAKPASDFELHRPSCYFH